MDQDNTEHTTENTVDLLHGPMQGMAPSTAGAVQAFMDQHRAQKAAATEEEDRTVELENGLQDLIEHVDDGGENGAAAKRPRQSQGSASAAPPVPKFAANDERTVELEMDLNAMLGAAGGAGDNDALNYSSTSSRKSSMSGGSRRNTVKGLSVQLLEDDSDDSTQEADEDDEAPDIRLSLDSRDSLTSAVSNVAMYPLAECLELYVT